MSELISGKEALEKYNESQVRLSSKEDWVDLKVSIFTITDILREKHFNGGWHGLLFRLKPQTITINGVEVPAPFEPKAGDTVWILSNTFDSGYRQLTHKSINTYSLQAWRTEDEIKQVVEVLKSIFDKR